MDELEGTVVTRVIKEVEFMTKEDWLDIKLCVDQAFVQTKDEALHIIAMGLLRKYFAE